MKRLEKIKRLVVFSAFLAYALVGSKAIAQYPVIDYSGLNPGVAMEEGPNIFTYAYEFIPSYTYEIGYLADAFNNGNGTGKYLKSIVPFRTYLRNQKQLMLNTDFYLLISNSPHSFSEKYLQGKVNYSLMKKVYYGDEDLNIIIKKADIFTGETADRRTSMYVFSSYGKKNEGYGVAQTGTTHTINYKGNFVNTYKKFGTKISDYEYDFKVSDWVDGSFRNGIEYSLKSSYGDLIKSKFGVEVYTMFVNEKKIFDWDINDVLLLRSIVYPKKPQWKNTIPAKLCKGTGLIDLRSWVDMKGLNFEGKFLVDGNQNSPALENSYYLNTDYFENIPADGKEITIRCYPYYVQDLTTSLYYQKVGFNVYMDVKVKIYGKPTLEDNGEMVVCSDEITRYLDRYNPTGGIYTGNYITSNTLSVKNAVMNNVYSVNVTYKYTDSNGCIETANYTQNIGVTPNVTFNLPTSTCENGEINLEELVTPKGGTFDGNGVEDIIFNPTTAGLGVHDIKYSTEGTCSASITKNITVKALLPSIINVQPIPKQCKDGNVIDLMGFVDSKGGEFSGSGISGGRYFDPKIANVGNNIITYRLEVGTCSKEIQFSIEVVSAIAVTFGSIPIICESKEITLTNYVSVSGGTFSGPGVVNDVFNSSLAGVGSHTIFYTISSGSCGGTAQKTIVVQDLLPANVRFKSVPSMCKNDLNSFIDLRGFIENHSGGTFSGSGVQGNYFYPSNANIGKNVINYTYGTGTCAKNITTEITVYGNDEVIFFTIPTLCSESVVDLMQYVYPQGGEFFGPGVIDRRHFDTKLSGTGKFNITYKYFNGNCYTNITKEITVDALISDNIYFQELPEVCNNGESINLREYVNTTMGVFSGTGVVDEYFNPNMAVAGVNVVKLTINEGGCKQVLSKKINILSPPDVTFNAIGSVCKDEMIDLNNYVFPYGGKFSGYGVENNFFDPTKSGIGEFFVNYEYENVIGCKTTKTQKIVVNGLLPSIVIFSDIPNLCPNSEAIDLIQFVEPKTGYFSGTGVIGNKFDPRVSGSGTFIIKYIIESELCKREVTKTIMVKSPFPTIFNDIPSICQDDPIELENYIFPTGGTFSGKGVQGTKFVPDLAGVGESFIYYSLNVDGCTTTTSKKVDVKATIKDFSFNATATMCKNEDPIDLWGYVSGYGGTKGSFSGNGIVGSIFSPTTANIGGNLIKFTISDNGCVMEQISTITILQSPSVTFNAIGDICKNEEIDLTNYVSVSGGTFSGVGVSNGKFNPGIAGTGTKFIYYQFTGANGCTENKQQSVNVKALLPSESSIIITAIPNLCENDNPVNLRDFINRTDGYFTGTGIVGNLFDPRVSGSGSFEIKYSNVFGTCKVEKSFTITVLSSPEVIFSAIPNVCFAGKIALSDYVYPKGGTFSGKGIVNDTLVVTLAGVGKHNIYYSYSSGGCVKSVSQTVTINAIIPDFKIKDFPPLCKNSDPIDLSGYIDGYTGTNGTFTGKGIVGGVLNPSQADIGGNLIKYTIVEGGCSREVSKTVTVVDNPAILFNTIPTVCNNKTIDLTNYVYPSGGSFTGIGVTGTTFDPSIAGVGETFVNYHITSTNGCYSTIQQKVTVNALIPSVIEFSDPGTLCKQGKEVYLRDLVNTEYGTFSGIGVTGDYFYPNNAQIGNNTVQFKIVQGVCSAEKVRTILVKDEGEIIFSEIPSVCYKNSIDLSNYVYPKGGVFKGNGVSGSVFNPELAGIGSHKILYEIMAESGCISFLERNIEVKNLFDAPENISVNLIKDICLNSPAIDLRQFVSPSGGYFSGTGIVGNLFDPSIAGVGVHQIYYTIGQVDCNQSKGFTIRVLGNGSVTVDKIPLVCGSDLLLSDYISPSGGIFTGKYVENGVFKGELAPNDTSEVKYIVETDEGCTVSKTIKIPNFRMPPVVINVSEDNIQTGGVIQFIPEGLSDNLEQYSYSWSFGDGGWSSEQKPWHYYYHKGVFDIRFNLSVKSNECYKEYKEIGALSVEDESGKKIFFKGKLIYEELPKEDISITPNPFSEGINVIGIEENTKVMLFDITGREVKRWNGSGFINLQELKSGIYLLHINGSSKKYKLVKQ